MAARAVAIGRAVRAQGLRGELRVQPWVEPLSLYRTLARLGADGEEGFGLRVERAHPVGKGMVAIKLEGVDSAEEAGVLVGRVLFAPREDLPSAEEGVYFWEELEGLAVYDEGGEYLGRVVDIYPTGSNEVLVVRGEREWDIPALRDVVRRVEPEAGRMMVRLPPGLGDEGDDAV
ncbi:MAG: ribosome maturation factor RimM [Nitrospinota bacterium]